MGIYIKTEGMKGIENDFERLSTPEPFEVGRERLDNALQIGFEGTQAAVPIGDDTDRRRPAGSLKATGRYNSSMSDGVWSAEIAYGYEGEDPIVNYAAWVRYRNLRRKGVDFLGDPMDHVVPLFNDAVNAPFDSVWHPNG